MKTRMITARRKEILHWLCRGKTNGEIGQILGIKTLTVKNHIATIRAIYGAGESRTNLAMHALAHGHVSFEDIKRDLLPLPMVYAVGCN